MNARDLSWQELALCQGHQTPDELWYAESQDGQEAARATCFACPAIDPCREYARDTRQQFGVWGGETALERSLVIGRLRHGSLTGYQAGCRCPKCRGASKQHRAAVSA